MIYQIFLTCRDKYDIYFQYILIIILSNIFKDTLIYF